MVSLVGDYPALNHILVRRSEILEGFSVLHRLLSLKRQQSPSFQDPFYVGKSEKVKLLDCLEVKGVFEGSVSVPARTVGSNLLTCLLLILARVLSEEE